MEVFEHRFQVDGPLEAVAAFHGDSSALRALTPPPMWVQLHRFGEMTEGMIAEFTLWLGPLPIRWTARHEGVGPTGFVDVQEKGPMASWRHTHAFRELGPGRTEVSDRIEYAHPKGVKGLWTRLLFARVGLRGLFAYRAWATQRGVRARSAEPG